MLNAQCGKWAIMVDGSDRAIKKCENMYKLILQKGNFALSVSICSIVQTIREDTAITHANECEAKNWHYYQRNCARKAHKCCFKIIFNFSMNFFLGNFLVHAGSRMEHGKQEKRNTEHKM